VPSRCSRPLPVVAVLGGKEGRWPPVVCGGQLATVVPGRGVAFEVDDIDVVTRTGWSVLGVGEAYEVSDPARLAELAARPEPWARGR
jgi:uncharacterized protein